jgi:hypothetical protein
MRCHVYLIYIELKGIVALVNPVAQNGEQIESIAKNLDHFASGFSG